MWKEVLLWWCMYVVVVLAISHRRLALFRKHFTVSNTHNTRYLGGTAECTNRVLEVVRTTTTTTLQINPRDFRNFCRFIEWCLPRSTGWHWLMMPFASYYRNEVDCCVVVSLVPLLDPENIEGGTAAQRVWFASRLLLLLTLHSSLETTRNGTTTSEYALPAVGKHKKNKKHHHHHHRHAACGL